MARQRAKSVQVTYCMEREDGGEIPDNLTRELNLFFRKYAKDHGLKVTDFEIKSTIPKDKGNRGPL